MVVSKADPSSGVVWGGQEGRGLCVLPAHENGCLPNRRTAFESAAVLAYENASVVCLDDLGERHAVVAVAHVTLLAGQFRPTIKHSALYNRAQDDLDGPNAHFGGVMIGRRYEQERLDHWVCSGRSELIVVHGRRRVGKTYFISSYFRGRFA